MDELDVLVGRPFHRREAEAHGITRRMLQGRRFARMHPCIYRLASTEPTLTVQVRAALMVLPPDAAVSRFTNLQLRGLDFGSTLPLHFATNRRYEIDRDGLFVHRHLERHTPELVDGLPLLDPARTFVDIAPRLDDRQLLGVGDWLVANTSVTQEALIEFAMSSHLNGVQRARRVGLLVRPRVASLRESDVRWHLGAGGLPEPEITVDIHADNGVWLACGDLVYRRFKVLVEYDGWQHERDARQRQWDHLRRESLEAAGWAVIVITQADLEKPHLVVSRVRQALRRRGWTG